MNISIGSNIKAARKKIGMIQEEILNSHANYSILCLYVERTANLSRFVGNSKQCAEEWPHIKNNAIKYGLQIIRFCSDPTLIERAHFAMAWIYIHERDYISAREHINTLPSVSNNRLQESILAQLTVFEKGVEEEKENPVSTGRMVWQRCSCPI